MAWKPPESDRVEGTWRPPESDRTIVASAPDDPTRPLDIREGGRSQRQIKLDVAKQLGTSPESVDISSSALPIAQRLAWGFMPDETARFQYLVQKFGEGNVRRVDDRGTERQLVFSEGIWKPVDEYGATASDFSVDLMPYIPQVATEVAVAIGTGGSSLPRAVRFLLPTVGGFITGLSQDTLARGGDPKLDDVARRGAEAGIGLAIEAPLAGMARALSPKIKDPVAEGFNKAKANLSKKGLVIPETAARVAGPTRKQRVLVGEDIIDSFTDIQRKVAGEGYDNIEPQLQRIGAQIVDNNRQLVRSMENNGIQVDRSTRDALGRMAQRNLDTLVPQKPITTTKSGMDLRAGLSKPHQDAMDKVGAMYDGPNGITERATLVEEPLEVLDSIFESLATDSGLAKDEVGDLMAEYAPALAKKWSKSPSKSYRQKKLKGAAEEVADVVDELDETTTIGWSRIHELRSALRENIQYGDRGTMSGISQPALKKIDRQLTELLEAGADRGGFRAQFDKANEIFQREVVPLRQGGLWSAQKSRGKPGYVADENVGAHLLDGKNAIDNIRVARKAGATDFIKAAKNEMQQRIIRGATKSNGTIDLSIVRQNIKKLNKDVYKELYGAAGSSHLHRIKQIDRLATASYHGRHIDPTLLDQYINAETDALAARYLRNIKSRQVVQEVDLAKMDAVHQYVARTGDLSKIDAYDFANSLWKMNGKEARAMVEKIKDPEQLDALRHALVLNFFDRSKTIKSDAAQQAMIAGNEVLFDPKEALSLFGNKRNLDMMTAILGEEHVGTLRDIAVAYGAAVRGSSRGKDAVLDSFTPYARAGQDGLNLRMLVNFSFLKDLAMAKGGTTTEFAGSLWSGIVGSTEGMVAIGMEANRDPDFKKSFIEAAKTARNTADALRISK